MASLLSSSLLSTNVYNGQGSSYLVTLNNGTQVTTGQYFQANASSVGAITIPASGGNVTFLGPAFFNPGVAGVTASYLIARAFMVMHEAIHLVGGLGDGYSGWGSSKGLTKLLVDKCFPALGASGALGGLYQ